MNLPALIRRKPVVSAAVAVSVVAAIVLATLAFWPDRAAERASGRPEATSTVAKAQQADDAERPAATPRKTAEATPATPAKQVPPTEYSDKPRTNDSKAEASLVGVRPGRAKGSETVTFSFTGKGQLPKYRVEYADAVRLYPDEDPIPVDGNAYLIVSFELTDPNQSNKLAFPPSLQPGQPQVKEVLLYDNLGGSLRFAIGLERKTRFRVLTPADPTRLVVEVQD